MVGEYWVYPLNLWKFLVVHFKGFDKKAELKLCLCSLWSSLVCFVGECKHTFLRLSLWPWMFYEIGQCLCLLSGAIPMVLTCGDWTTMLHSWFSGCLSTFTFCVFVGYLVLPLAVLPLFSLNKIFFLIIDYDKVFKLIYIILFVCYALAIVRIQ